MKKIPLFKLFSFIFIISYNPLIAQSIGSDTKDTSNYPYWIEMMRDNSISFYRTQSAFNQYWKNREIKKGTGYNVYKRWAYMRQLETDSLGFLRNPNLNSPTKTNSDIDPVAFGLTGIDSSTECFFDTVWSAFGPYNNQDAGRANTICFHPSDTNTMLVGAPSGGLWKTEDRGLSWKFIDIKAGTSGISSIAWDKFDLKTIYVGTGDFNMDAPGKGIYKSTDGGTTWLPINTGIPNGTIVIRILIDPGNSNILIIGTNSGVYRSINGGKTWKLSTLSGNPFISDIVFNTSYSNQIYCSSGGYIFKSIDSGKVFKLCKGINKVGYRGAIAVTPNDSSIVYYLFCNSVDFNALYRSTDFGDSFVLVTSSPNLMSRATDGSDNTGQAFYCMDIAVNPKNKNDVFVGGINIFRSQNGGTTWSTFGDWLGQRSPYIHADIHSLEFSHLSKILYATCDGGVYYRTNTKWQSLSKGLNIHQTYKISTNDEGKLIAGFQDNGSWTRSRLPNTGYTELSGGDGLDNAIGDKNDYTSFQEGNILKNGNLLAKKGTNGINEDGNWLTPFVLKENQNEIMFAGFKNIWRSSDLNSSSVQFTNVCDNVSTGTAFVLDIENSPINNDVLYFCRVDGNFYRTDNASAIAPTWTRLTTKMPIGGLIQDIQSSYLDSSMVFITINDKVYKSVNKGMNWVNISSGLTGVNVYCLAIDSSNNSETLYCGTSNGIYCLTPSSSKWMKYGKKFPENVKVTDLEISFNKTYQPFNVLYASTYGSGVWSIPMLSFKDKAPITKYYIPKSTNLYCTGSTFKIYDESIGNNIHHEWHTSPQPDSIFNYDSTGTIYAISFKNTGRHKVLKATYNCAGSDTVSTDHILVVENTSNPICIGKTLYKSNPGDYGIKSLRINSNSSQSTGTKTSGEYQDLRCKTVYKLKAGAYNSYSVSYHPSVAEYFKLYIDLNADGILSESEVVKYKNSKNIFNDSFYLPSNIPKNKSLLIRAISDYYPIDTISCPTISFGQTEDHMGYVLEEIADFSTDKYNYCISDTVTFTDRSTGNFIDYYWNFGNNASPQFAYGKGPHKVIYSDTGFKTVELRLNANINTIRKKAIDIQSSPLINIFNHAPKAHWCEGEIISLKATNIKNDSFNTHWSFNQSIIGISDSLQIKDVQLKDSGYYYAIAENSCGKDTAQYHLNNIKEMPKAGFTVNADTQCLNDNEFQLMENSACSTPYQFYWNDDPNQNTKTKNHKYSTHGTFTHKLMVMTGFCKDSTARSIIVNPMADTGFHINKLSELTYEFEPRDTALIGYYWSFGDGQTSVVKRPTHTFGNINKDYKVMLISNNQWNCYDSAIQNIQIKATALESKVFKGLTLYPNPSSDQLNIQFISSINESLSIKIIDLKGSIVFEKDLICREDCNETIKYNEHQMISGVYFVEIASKNKKETFKIIIF